MTEKTRRKSNSNYSPGKFSALVKSNSSPTLISSHTLSTLHNNLALADDILSRALTRANPQSSVVRSSQNLDASLKKPTSDSTPLWKTSIEEFRQGTFAVQDQLKASPSSAHSILSPATKSSSSISFNEKNEFLEEERCSSDTNEIEHESLKIQEKKEEEAVSVEIQSSLPNSKLNIDNEFEVEKKIHSHYPTLTPTVSFHQVSTLPKDSTSDHLISNPHVESTSLAHPTSLPHPILKQETNDDISCDLNAEATQMDHTDNSLSLVCQEPRISHKASEIHTSNAIKKSLALVDSNGLVASEHSSSSLIPKSVQNLTEVEPNLDNQLTTLQTLHDKIIKMNMAFLEQHNNMLYHTSTVVKHQAEEHRKLFEEMIEDQTAWQATQAQVLSQTSASLIQ
ncbi:hypothetical protein HMI56_002590, partial [Coelomomyces lativittatus]